MTVVEEFAQLLADLGLGIYSTGIDATIFLLAMPDGPAGPDRCKAVAPYPGREADSKISDDEPRIQIRCRSKNPAEVMADAQAVYDALMGAGWRTLPGGTWLQLIVALQSGPAYIGQDKNGRHEFTVNVRAEIERPTVNRV